MLHVTRERAADRRYGLGKSLQPMVDELGRRGIRALYFTQEDYPRVQSRSSAVWWATNCILRRLRSVPSLSALADALLERLCVGRAAAHLAQAEGFNLVHFHDPWLALWACLQLPRRSSRGFNWGITEHGFGAYFRAVQADGLRQTALTQRLLRLLERFILYRAHWVILPTSLAREALRRDLALAFMPKNWQVIRHARPQAAKFSREQARALLCWETSWFVVVAVGRIVPLKQMEAIVRACSRLALRYPDLHLQIVGEGDHAPLVQLAEAASFLNRLHVNAAESAAKYLAASDLYLSLSTTESFGLANLEALCFGLPSICSAVGGVPEVVGNAALLIQPDEVSLCAALSQVLDEPNLRLHLARLARERACGWPTIEEVTDAYLAVYAR